MGVLNFLILSLFRAKPENQGLLAGRKAPKRGVMSNPEPTFPPPHKLRDTVVNHVESYAREEPIKATSAAFGVGILLALLPLGSIVSGFLRLLFLVARPVLLILGVVKVAEEIDSRRSRSVDQEPLE